MPSWRVTRVSNGPPYHCKSTSLALHAHATGDVHDRAVRLDALGKLPVFLGTMKDSIISPHGEISVLRAK